MINIFLIAIMTFVIQIIFTKSYLNILEKKDIIQPLLKEGPDHAKKAGTATMGGISFVITITIVSFITLILSNQTSQTSLIIYFTIIFIFLSYAFIGYKDDILKVTNKQNDSGLSPKQKLIAQFFLAIIFFIILDMHNFDMSINLFIFDWKIDFANQIIQQAIYFIFLLFLMAGMSNATNLTDGLDGLLTSTYIVSLLGLGIIAYIQNRSFILLFIIIVIASLLGFLMFNANPAKVFMGDTASLALGALLAVLVVLLKVEILILLIGFVFIFETLTVVIQVLYFRHTKKKYGKGKRFFLMAPYHHHLEKKGFSENEIVILLSLVQFVAVIIAIIIYI